MVLLRIAWKFYNYFTESALQSFQEEVVMERISGRLNFATVFLAVMLLAGLVSCKANTGNTTPSTTPPVSPGGPITGTVINSDSVITANIQAIRKQTTGYPWEIDIIVLTSANVDSLPNPTAGDIGKMVTVKTDQDMSAFQANQIVTGRVKDVGDVPKPGITLYMYSINISGG
jgi:hypothetical protein